MSVHGVNGFVVLCSGATNWEWQCLWRLSSVYWKWWNCVISGPQKHKVEMIEFWRWFKIRSHFGDKSGLWFNDLWSGDIEEKISEAVNHRNHAFTECIWGAMCFAALNGNECGRDVKNKNIDSYLLERKECNFCSHDLKRYVRYQSANWWGIWKNILQIHDTIHCLKGKDRVYRMNVHDLWVCVMPEHDAESTCRRVCGLDNIMSSVQDLQLQGY